MKLVLDASVALKWVLVETNSDAARRLRQAFTQHVHDLIAPDTFAVEVAHALTKAERRGFIGLGQANLLLAKILSTRPALHSYLRNLPRAVEISSTVRIGGYDCLYLARAESENCELVTADNRLVNAMPGFPIVSLDSF